MEEPIVCHSSIDTFLATSSVKPMFSEKPRRTVAEIKKTEQELLDILESKEQCPKGFWDNKQEIKGKRLLLEKVRK